MTTATADQAAEAAAVAPNPFDFLEAESPTAEAPVVIVDPANTTVITKPEPVRPDSDSNSNARTVPAVHFAVTDTSIAALKTRLATLKASTPAEYKQLVLGIAEVRDLRVAVEKRRKDLKADALEWGRIVDSEAKRITAALEEIEAPLKLTKQSADDEKERARKEKAEAERRKIEEELAAKRAQEEAEFKAARETEEARIAAEHAALAEERRKLEEARVAEENRAKAEREHLEAEQQAERERQRVEQSRLESERQAIAEERAKLAREDEERKAAVLAEQEAKDAVERERLAAEQRATEEAEAERRREALRPDVEKIHSWAEAIRALPRPEVTSPEAVAAVSNADLWLRQTADRLAEFKV